MKVADGYEMYYIDKAVLPCMTIKGDVGGKTLIVRHYQVRYSQRSVFTQLHFIACASVTYTEAHYQHNAVFLYCLMFCLFFGCCFSFLLNWPSGTIKLF